MTTNIKTMNLVVNSITVVSHEGVDRFQGKQYDQGLQFNADMKKLYPFAKMFPNVRLMLHLSRGTKQMVDLKLGQELNEFNPSDETIGRFLERTVFPGYSVFV